MKKRKSFFSRQRKRSGRYGLEAAVLCLLLLFAAYVSSAEGPENTARNSARNIPGQTERVLDAAATALRHIRTDAVQKTSAEADEREYRLVRASDGDSFELEDDKGRKVCVRLYGIDAPESRQRFGNKSREHLIDMLKGRTLRMKTLYRDSYKRSVALVYLCSGNTLDERSVNQRQVQAGMAWVYDRFCTSDICNTWKVEESLARKEKLGLWKDKNPTPPWQWRRSHKR